MMPMAEEYADFINLVDYVAIQLWDDSENVMMKEWLDQGETRFKPTGEVLGVVVGFNGTPIEDGNRYGVGLYAGGDEVYFMASEGVNGVLKNPFTAILSEADIPIDGLSDDTLLNSIDWDAKRIVTNGFTDGYSGGIGEDFGMWFDVPTNALTMWNWNNGELDWNSSDYQVYMVQWDAQYGQVFTVSGLVTVGNGAQAIAAATFAAASLLSALI